MYRAVAPLALVSLSIIQVKREMYFLLHIVVMEIPSFTEFELQKLRDAGFEFQITGDVKILFPCRLLKSYALNMIHRKDLDMSSRE